MQRHFSYIRRAYPESEGFLFPNKHMAGLWNTIKRSISSDEYDETWTSRRGPKNGSRNMSAKVSGAQMLTRLGLRLETVQLIGRWGSDAIKVYVQETPLHHGNSFFSSPDIDKPRQVREMVKHYLETLKNKFWIVNTATGVVHLPCAIRFGDGRRVLGDPCQFAACIYARGVLCSH